MRSRAGWVALLVASLSLHPAAAARTGQTASAPPTPAAEEPATYVCAMHPEVVSSSPGYCFKCGMPLIKVVSPRETSVLELEADPAAPRPGEKVRMRFSVSHPGTRARIKDFNLVHGMPFHLFVIRHDLEVYEHVHPALQPDGTFALETALPAPGLYDLFCDFFPAGGVPQVVHRTLATAGWEDSGGDGKPLDADETRSRSVEGVRFELTLDPPQPVAGRPTRLVYDLKSEEDGRPVTDLEPYLGAWGHTVTLGEGATDFLHTHAAISLRAVAERRKVLGESRVAFTTFFARPGTHRIWSQFQRRGRVITVSFTVPALRLDRVARWDGAAWSALPAPSSLGVNGTVRAIALQGSAIYLGGDFTGVGGIHAPGFARWDGRSWSSPGGGVAGRVWAIAAAGRDVYAAGDFSSAGGVRARGVARWDGSRWRSLGGGVDGCEDGQPGAVYALAATPRGLFAGGHFCSAGGVRTAGVARWDGSGWSALDGGVRTGIYDGVVRALAWSGKDLYAGGQFLSAGDTPVYNVARWDGRRWSALGRGVQGNLEQVLAIGVSSRDVYVGGVFNSAGGKSASGLAKWDGKDWSPAAVEPSEGVSSLAVRGPEVYLGGASFRLPGGAVARGVVRWDGRSWSGLGEGPGAGTGSGPVLAIAAAAETVYVGGNGFSLSPTPEPSVEAAGK